MASPPYHPPAVHPPARPPVVIRPPTLPNQIILEQRRAREMSERQRAEENLSLSGLGNEAFWSDAHDLSHDEMFAILADIKPQISGLEDETRDDAKRRVLAELDSLDMEPSQKERVKSEIEFKFRNEERTANAHRDNFVRNVASNFYDLTRNLANPSQGDITNALREAIVLTNNKFLKDLAIHTGGSFVRHGHSFDINIDRSVDETKAYTNIGPAIQAMRVALGGGSEPAPQVASVAPADIAPAPPPQTPALEAPTLAAQPDPANPIATRSPTLRETAAPNAQVSTENTTPIAARTPTVRETVVVTPTETPPHGLLTPVPTYTPTDAHSTSGPTVPIQTTSVPTRRDRPSMPSVSSDTAPPRPSFIGSIAAIVGPQIRSGVTTAANWLAEQQRGDAFDRRNKRTLTHGIGNGMFEGLLGIQMKPTKVIKGGYASGSNIGGGLIL